MNVILTSINAKYIHSNPAVYDLRAFASEYKEHILLGEYTINQTKDEILKEIYRSGAEVVCFSCYIWNISFVRELIFDLKKILPGTAFWVGGPEVSFDAENFLKEMPQVTGVMVGEGEETFLELARYYIEKKGTLADIRGIAFRENGEIFHNGWREVMDLSRVPFAYEQTEDFANRIIYYESSRGCPFSCSYCLSSIDKKLRFRNLELVKKELQFFLDKKVPQVKFVDRTFNCKHDHAMEIWKYILEHDNGVTNFHFEISADLLREEELELMSRMRPGLIQLEIGVQSTNPDTIRAIHRNMDLKKLEASVARVKSFGNIHQHLDLIAGLPGESAEEMRDTLAQIEQLGPDSLTIHSLAIKRAAKMGQYAKANRVSKAEETFSGEIGQMVEDGAAAAKRMGLLPYYLYRQKNIAGNFENVGYAKVDKAGIYNILIMEEKQTIVACGAGTTTKVVYPAEMTLENGKSTNLIRIENVKNITEYISRIDEMIERKGEWLWR